MKMKKKTLKSIEELRTIKTFVFGLVFYVVIVGEKNYYVYD